MYICVETNNNLRHFTPEVSILNFTNIILIIRIYEIRSRDVNNQRIINSLKQHKQITATKIYNKIFVDDKIWLLYRTLQFLVLPIL